MTRADETEIPVPALALDAEDSASRSGAFWLHATAWLVFYLTVVIAWGQRNSWPSDLLLCVLALPLTILVASTLFVSERFGLVIEPGKSQQEQLISALVLAVGLASGQVLLMALGLVCLGIAWLRPASNTVDWAEWLKIPVLFLTALPFWLDFEGSRLAVAAWLEDPSSNPAYRLPLALEITQAQVLGYCGLVSMALFLRGRGFWLCLPALPVFLVGVTLLPRWFPAWSALDPLARAVIPWLLGAACLAMAARFRQMAIRASRHVISGATLRFWFEGRRYPPWLAVTVVAVVHALPLESVRFRLEETIGLLGLGVLVALLLGLRLRTPKGPIHSRSVAMVAGGLALTLLAEFATSAHLRHVALGFVLVGLVSWHCFWPLRVFVVAGLTIVLMLAIPENLRFGHQAVVTLVVLRFGAAALGLSLLAWFSRQPLPQPGARGYGDEGWVPPKRFALILLGLMMLFQTASAFWPEHDFEVPESGPATDQPAVESELAAGVEPGWQRVPSARGPVQLLIAYPRKNPYLLASPESALRRRGWKVVERLRAPHPQGEATAVRLERDGTRASALWWFELGDRSFSSHLYARRVLWSGWHLADRRLRLVRIESTAIVDPHDLIAVARRERWFTPAGAGLRTGP